MNDAAKNMARKLAAEYDAVITKALKDHHGGAMPLMEDVKRHASLHGLLNGMEVFAYKGTALVEIHPVELKYTGQTVTATRKYRRLYSNDVSEKGDKNGKISEERSLQPAPKPFQVLGDR